MLTTKRRGGTLVKVRATGNVKYQPFFSCAGMLNLTKTSCESVRLTGIPHGGATTAWGGFMYDIRVIARGGTALAAVMALSVGAGGGCGALGAARPLRDT